MIQSPGHSLVGALCPTHGWRQRRPTITTRGKLHRWSRFSSAESRVVKLQCLTSTSAPPKVLLCHTNGTVITVRSYTHTCTCTHTRARAHKHITPRHNTRSRGVLVDGKTSNAVSAKPCHGRKTRASDSHRCYAHSRLASTSFYLYYPYFKHSICMHMVCFMQLVVT